METASGLSTEPSSAAAAGGRPHEDPKLDVERNQDDVLARQTNTRHKKVTADKWNQ